MVKTETAMKSIAKATIDLYIIAGIPKDIMLKRATGITDMIFDYQKRITQCTGAYFSKPLKSEIDKYIRNYIEERGNI